MRFLRVFPFILGRLRARNYPQGTYSIPIFCLEGFMHLHYMKFVFFHDLLWAKKRGCFCFQVQPLTKLIYQLRCNCNGPKGGPVTHRNIIVVICDYGF